MSITSVDCQLGERRFNNRCSSTISIAACRMTEEGEYLEKHVFGLLKNPDQAAEYGMIVTNKNYRPARAGVPVKVGGYLSQMNIVMESMFNEVLLKIECGYHAKSTTVGTVFVVLRRGGEIGKLETTHFVNRKERFGKPMIVVERLPVLSGQFEIVSVKEAAEKYGCRLPSFQRANASPSSWGRIMKHTLIKQETNRKPVTESNSVITETGETVQVPSRFIPRKLG